MPLPPTKRDDVLEAAEACFYEAGITASGVDWIATRADVSKRTLYNHFDSKEDLVLAYVNRREERWRRTLAAALDGIEDPRQRLEVYLRTYVDLPVREQRGCAFLNAAAELPTGHPALRRIADIKAAVQDDLRDILEDLDHHEPTGTAAAIAAILEGACTMSGVQRSTIELDPLVAAALQLATPE